jgi:drug/metabolite transporter (DMT)-like permease
MLKLILLATGFLALSLTAFLTKLCELELSPVVTIFDRFLIATAILWIWRGIQNLRHKFLPENQVITLSLHDLRWLFADSLLITASLIMWAYSLNITEVATAHLLHHMTPIFATLGGWILLDHIFDNRFIVGMVCTIIGSSMIVIHDFYLINYSFAGDLLALLSAVLYAYDFVIREKLRSKLSASIILRWWHLFGVILMLPIVLFNHESILPSTLFGWISVLSLELT